MGHNKVGILYFNVANSNKSENLAVSCQWQMLTESLLVSIFESYLTRSTKLLWSNFTNHNPTTNPFPNPQL